MLASECSHCLCWAQVQPLNPFTKDAALAGFAIADVNYGGSTGYGREYRNRLRRNWGIVDVADCSNAAKHLAKQGKADEKRLCIDGGSAGGYTTLACLAFRSDCFQPRLCACLACVKVLASRCTYGALTLTSGIDVRR